MLIVLNLIEKLQKENKELKETYKILNDLFWNECVPKQTIKDKIEELKEQDREWTEELSEPDSNFKVIDRHLKRIKNQIDVLQELFEKKK